MKRPLTCDQVVWVKQSLERLIFAANNSHPGISRLRDVALVAALLEIMAICGLCFEDDSARHNAICHIPELYQTDLKEAA